MTNEILNIGNYNFAGTLKFITHRLKPDEETTLCGLKFSKLKGDWQVTDNEQLAPACKNCMRISK